MAEARREVRQGSLELIRTLLSLLVHDRLYQNYTAIIELKVENLGETYRSF